jgi:hypothetical protein
LAAPAGKLPAENEERGCGSDDHKNYDYGHDCRTAPATFIITHKIKLSFMHSEFGFHRQFDRVSVMKGPRKKHRLTRSATSVSGRTKLISDC